MEEDNDLEQVTGSPTAGESGFVHVESVDSAQTETGSINQVEHLEQDDGVVITGVDAVQDEPHDERTHEDGGLDEFVDCPDDLVSTEARSPTSASMAQQQPFRDDTEDIQFKATDSEKDITPQDYEEERRLMKEVSNIYHQLKALSRQQSSVDENEPPYSSDLTFGTEGGGEKSILPLREMVKECSKFVEFSMNDRLQSDGTIKELYATLHMKDKEIEDLRIRVNEQLQDVSSFEVVIDRILSPIVTASGAAVLSDTSVSGKLSYLEENTSFLLQSYNYFLYEVDMLARCLAEVKSDFHLENYMETVFPSTRDELVGLKRKEIELNEKNAVLMEQLDKNRETVELLNAEIGKLKGEIEQEKTRYGNTKEKLSMAVTKGKALVQQRDQLKQLVAEKSDDLERCLLELQEKSTALEAAELRNGELTQSQTFAHSLQEALTQRDSVLEKCAELLCQGLPEVAQFPNLESQVSWLLESYNLVKDQAIKLHDENIAIKETASAQIDHLTLSLLVESQDKHRLKEELEEISCKYHETDIEAFEKIQNLLYISDLESKIYEQILELDQVKISEELHASKDELNSLQINLQRSEEKASLLREKLSMAVKKGKGLVQDRENMKQQMAEKNAQIEALTVDFQKQESTLNNYRDQVAKLESERDQIGQFLAQSNTLLQDIIEIIDGINITFPSDLKEPVEKMKWFATYLSECQVGKAQAEHEVSQLANKLTEVLVNLKSLEDALSASEENISQLSEKKRELEASKIQLQEEIDVLNDKLMETLKTLKSLEDKLAGSEKTIGLLTKEKSELEIAKCHAEEELHKAMEEITSQTSNVSMLIREKEEAQMEAEKVKTEVSFHASSLDDGKKTIQSLEEELHRAMEEITSQTSNISMLTNEKEEAQMEVQRVKEEASFHASNLDDAKKTIKSLEEELHRATEKITSQTSNISMLTNEKEEARLEVQRVKDEASFHASNLDDAKKTIKALEEELHRAMEDLTSQTSSVYMLTNEKEEARLEVQRVKEEASFHASNLDDAKKTIKYLEEELHKAVEEITSQKSNISMLMSEKEEAQMEVQRVKEEVSFHASNLDGAKKTIKSLEDSIVQLQTNISQFSHENEQAVDSRTILESEIKKLKEEAKHEISTLKTELSSCRDELASVKNKWAPQLSGFFGNLQMLLKDESLFSLFKQSFEKKIECLKEIDLVLKDMKDNFAIEQLQDHPAIEEDFQSPTFLPAEFAYDWNTGMIDDEFDADDTEGISLYVGKAFDNLNTKNRILANQFGNFSTHIDDIIASLLKKLEAMRNTIPSMVQQKLKNIQMDKQMQENKVVMLENGINVLLSVCADVTKDLELHFENNMLQPDPNVGLEKSYPGLLVDDAALADVKVAAKKLLFAARNVQNVAESLQIELKETSLMYDKSKEVIEGLQIELENTSSMYDKSKGIIEELQGQLEKARSMYEKFKEENDGFQKVVFNLETELEASRRTCNEMNFRLEDYQEKEDKWNERERELSVQSIASVNNQEGDSEKALLSASQVKTLFDKIDGITIPFQNLLDGDKQPQDLNPVEKLFYIVDSVNELLDQLTLLAHTKEDLRSTVSKQALEVDHLKGEFSNALQNIIYKLGGDELVGFKKSADVAGLLLVLERLVQGIVLDGQNSKSKLMETQKLAEDLSNKVKLMEDFIQKRTGGPDIIQERGVFGSSSFPAGSEISEIDDQGTSAKVGLPVVSSAAQMRSLRKGPSEGSSEHLAITVDPESERLLDKAKTVEDKGHIFKSLHTSGLVPVQGKMLADRLDGLWVSGGQALMRRPRARLGLIAYWVVLHLWLLGTLL